MMAFNPFDYCEKVYIKQDGTPVRHNAIGVCDQEELRKWALENHDKVEPFPEISSDVFNSIAVANREAAYVKESDRLYLEAFRLSLVTGDAPDWSSWLDKVREIKERYPKR